MNLFELFEERKPASFVANRDFDLVPNSEYKGYVLGVEDDSDAFVHKSTYAVYKLTSNNEYIRIHTVLDPKTNNAHKLTVRNIIPMYKYTVDQVKSGNIKPTIIAVMPPDAPSLNESYTDRVQTVADAVIARSKKDPLKKEELPRIIEWEASYNNVIELRFKDTPKSTTWKEFVKDVLAKLKGNVILDNSRGPSSSAAAKRVAKDQLLSKIASEIQFAVGQAFPDGDPLDILIPKLQRMGIDTYNVHDWLDAASKKNLGVKNFDSYMAALYDDYAGDQPDILIKSGIMSNPYSGKPFDFINQIGDLFKYNQTETALTILYSIVPQSNPNTLKVLNQNKDLIIKTMLAHIKQFGIDRLIKGAMNNIIKMGLDWPEFEAIKRSSESKLTEEFVRDAESDADIAENMGYIRDALANNDYENSDLWDCLLHLGDFYSTAFEYPLPGNAKLFEKHKHGFLTVLLRKFKDGSFGLSSLPQIVLALRKMKVTWPELNIIEKVLKLMAKKLILLGIYKVISCIQNTK